jgi:nucleotidyltransferase AbiEii toxin of type IV toxin-antitoxin system
MPDPNLELLHAIVLKLGPLAQEFVFVGGCTIGLLITDEATAPTRPTKDVDGIAEVYSYAEFSDFEARLDKIGFRRAPDGPICRWESGGLLLDVMPIRGEFLGFNSNWFEQAVKTSEMREIAPNTKIRVATSVFILATKLEAFHDRGNDDFLGSRDLEDLITLINGRPELVDEVRCSDVDVRAFIINSFKKLVDDRAFIESIPGHLMPDMERSGLVLKRISAITGTLQN